MSYHTSVLLILPLLFFFTHLILARKINPSSSSFVLGLTHLRSSGFAKASSLQTLDLVEPLREVRDGYLITLNIGTPPQAIQVYLDTGSDLTWVPCGNISFDCMDCDEYKDNNFLSTFSPSRSDSCTRDSCSSSFCLDIHSSDNPFDPCTVSGCSLSTLVKSNCARPCPSFAYTYGEGGFVTGTLTRDTLRAHDHESSTSREINSRFCFGCVGSTYREPIGIAGFGRGPLSLPSQLGFLEKGFSHCFLAFKFANNPNISSPLVIGDGAISNNDNNTLQFTPMLKSPMYPNYYYIGLEAITVGNTHFTGVPLSLREFDSRGNGGMLIDSGTTYTHLPEPFHSELLAVFQTMVSFPRAVEMEEQTGFDICYKVPCPNNKLLISNNDDHLFPSITFHFLNNVSLVLPQGNTFYAVSAPRNSTVVKCLLFQRMDADEGDYGPAAVFGSFQQQNVEVVYDLKRGKIGFQPMDCAVAAASKGLHKNS